MNINIEKYKFVIVIVVITVIVIVVLLYLKFFHDMVVQLFNLFCWTSLGPCCFNIYIND